MLPMITFKNVSKQFFNQSYGLKDVSFTIEPGEIALVTGPTGSGKTTLMRLLTKEYQPTSGQIIFNQTPLEEIKGNLLPQHRRQIGIVFQDYQLLPEYNTWENVALPLSIAGKKEEKIEERVTDLLQLVGLTDKAELFPRELSGGEAQRVGIARALATAPPVLFADELTGNLDQDTALDIIQLLKKINQLETTVLIATHDVVVMEALKEIRKIELDDGKLVAGAQEIPRDEDGENEDENEDEKEEEEDGENEDEEKKEEVEKEEVEKDEEKEKKKEKKKIKLPKFKIGLKKKETKA